MAKRQILLINPPVKVEEIYGKYSDLAAFQPPIGLCCLAAYLRQSGYAVQIIDAAVRGLDVPRTAQLIAGMGISFVGVYANTANFYSAASLAAALRQKDPEMVLVVGGPHPSAMPAQALSESCFDCAVFGEGEETLRELAAAHENNSRDYRAIRGVAFRNPDGTITVNEARPLIPDLDTLPFPAVDLLPELRAYRLYLLHYKTLPYMTMVTARGCPYRCVFCTTPFGRRVRYHSPAYVADYIAHLGREFGIRELHFSDDTFTVDEERVAALCALLRSRRLRVNWYAGIRADLKEHGLLEEMRRSGCWIAAVGAESGDERILKLIKKNVTLGQISETSRLVRRAGMRLKAFFIIGHPGETVDSIDATIRFAVGLKAHFPVFSLMTPYPGTELWETAGRYGAFDKTNFARLVISTSDPIFIPHGLTKEILLAKQQEAFRRTYCNAGMFFRQAGSIDSAADLLRKTKAAGVFLTKFIMAKK